VAGPYVGVADAELARRAAAGDAGAFERLVGRYRGEIARAALCWLRSRDDAEDVTQETFARALEGIGHLERPEAVGPWLHGIASNVCRETLRERSRLVFCGTKHDPLSPSWHAALDSWHSDLGRTVLQAVAVLTVQERALLVLHCLEGVGLSEVGDLFQVSAGAAKMRLCRARAAAREVALRDQPSTEEVPAALAEGYYYLANAYFGHERWAQSQRCWQRALALAPQTAESIWDNLKSLNYVPHSHEGIEAALRALEQGLQRHPNEPRLWLSFAKVLHFSAGEVERALSALQRAVKSNRLRGHALLTMAYLFARIGSATVAIETLALMERERLWDCEIPLVRALAFLAAGVREAAVSEARRALSLAMSNPDHYRVAHRHYVPGAVLAHFGVAKEARAAFQAAIQADPPAMMVAAIKRALARLAASGSETAEPTLWLACGKPVAQPSQAFQRSSASSVSLLG